MDETEADRIAEFYKSEARYFRGVSAQINEKIATLLTEFELEEVFSFQLNIEEDQEYQLVIIFGPKQHGLLTPNQRNNLLNAIAGFAEESNYSVKTVYNDERCVTLQFKR